MKSKTLPQSKSLPREVITKAQDNRHLIMGYLFLGIVFVGAISSVYYWEYKAKTSIINPAVNRHVESGEQSPSVNSGFCELETTMARQKTTGEIRDFPSPCHVTENWEILD